MTSSELVDAYLRRLHRAARKLPADERDELLIGLGARAEQIRAQELDDTATVAALGGLGDPDVIVADALGAATPQRFRPRLVVWTLAIAWVAVLAATALGFALRAPGGLPVFIAAASIIQAAGLAVLVLSLVGTMWHRWRDTFATLALLLLANSVSPVMIAVLASNSQCEQRGGLVPCSATTGGLVLRTVLCVVLIAALFGSVHWVSQLRRVAGRPAAVLSGRSLIGIGIGAAALSVAVFLAAGQVGPAERVTAKVVNDTGHDVRVTVCPKQNCAGQPTTTLADGDHFELPAGDSDVPDSVVVRATGRPTVCLLSMSVPEVDDAAQFTGTFDMPISKAADAMACGMDVDTLDNP